MNKDRFKFRIPMFSDKGTFLEFQDVELGEGVECTLCGHNGQPEQCTGLRDKNGKLIYEGDVVAVINEITGVHIIAKVVFNDKCARFVLENKPTNRWGFTFVETEYERLGNIHENTELLKGGEG